MARFLPFLSGGIRGRLGDFCIYTWRGKSYLRRRPQITKPASPLQKLQRGRMTAVIHFFHSIRGTLLYAIWNKAAEKKDMNGCNLFVSANIHAFSGEGLICDFSKICLSSGRLQLPYNIGVIRIGKQTLLLEWECDEWMKASRPDDRLVVALMKCADAYTIVFPEVEGGRRSDERAVVRLTAEEATFPHLYCLFVTKTEDEFSADKYFLILS